MRKICSAILIIIATTQIQGCSAKLAAIYAGEVTHKYGINLVDITGSPIRGAAIKYTLTVNSEQHRSGKELTGENGVFFIEVIVPIKYKELTTSKTSMLNYEIILEDYYSETGRIFSTYGSPASEDKQTQKTTVTLYRAKDFLNPEFSIKDISLLDKIELLTNRVFKKPPKNASLNFYSIGISTFKKRRYLDIEIISNNVYNSIQLNKHQIGTRVFDGIVRQVLFDVHEIGISSSDLYGVNVKILTHTRDFVSEISNTPLRYQFYIPNEIIAQYREKEITRRELVKDSLILVNEEKIEIRPDG